MSAFLGVLVYLPSVYVLFKQGATGIVAIDTVALLTMFGLLLLDRLPFRWRAAGACLIYYALGVGLLMTVGSISQIYLLGFSIIVVLLLGVRVGLCSAVLCSVSLLVVGAVQRAAPGMVMLEGNHNFTEWVLITINFTLVNTLLTLAVGAVVAALNNALALEIASRISLDHERKLLRTLIDTLPDVVFTKDANGRFVNCNPATLALYGVDREDQVVGKTVFDLDQPELARLCARRHAHRRQAHAGDRQRRAG